MNFIDKAIAYINPVKGVQREKARIQLDVINAGYGNGGASYAKKSLQGWLTKGLSADEDIVDNVETMQARTRDLFMNSALSNGAFKTIRTNVVGSGLMLNTQIDAEFLGLSEEEAQAWEKNTEREWRLWAETVDCDAERRQTFYQLQSLVLLSSLMSGDVFVTMPFIKRKGSVYDLRIGLIEADRVCNPDKILNPDANILGGVEIGEYGEAIAYWVSKYNPRSYPRLNVNKQNEWKRVLAFGKTTGRRNILHIMADVERPAQRRGVPLLAPVIESLKQLSRYTEAELMAAVISGYFTVFIESNSPNSPIQEVFDPSKMPNVSNDKSAYKMAPGMIIGLEQGEKVSTANPGRPNTAFDGFVMSICRQIGTALEIPYELLIKNFTASYSASRAALLEAWKMFRMRREWIVSNFCQPVYEEWLTEAILKGRIQAPGFFDDPAIRAAWCGADWHGDSQGQLDPLKEVNAAKVRVEEGFSTREREAAELTGMKFDDIHRIRVREEKMRREDGLTGQATVTEKTGEKQDDTDDDDE